MVFTAPGFRFSFLAFSFSFAAGRFRHRRRGAQSLGGCHPWLHRWGRNIPLRHRRKRRRHLPLQGRPWCPVFRRRADHGSAALPPLSKGRCHPPIPREADDGGVVARENDGRIRTTPGADPPKVFFRFHVPAPGRRGQSVVPPCLRGGAPVRTLGGIRLFPFAMITLVAQGRPGGRPLRWGRGGTHPPATGGTPSVSFADSSPGGGAKGGSPPSERGHCGRLIAARLPS